MKSLTHILERAEVTRTVAAEIEGWQWSERSPAQWDQAIQHFSDCRRDVIRAQVLRDQQRDQWEVRLNALHEFTTAVVRLGRVHFRARPALARTFDFVKPDAKSRASITAAASRLSALWQQLAPNWQPEPNWSRAAFDALRETCAACGAGCVGREAAAVLAAVPLEEAAAQLDEDCVAWYAAATAVFGPDTLYGGIMRREIPTSAVPQPPPGQAVITEVTTGPDGTIAFNYSAPHGTRFTVLHRPPGAAGYQPLRVDTADKSLTLQGLIHGEHRFQVIPSNSRGEGPESAELVVTLPARAAVA